MTFDFALHEDGDTLVWLWKKRKKMDQRYDHSLHSFFSPHMIFLNGLKEMAFRNSSLNHVVAVVAVE